MSLKLAATFPLIFLRDWILVLVLILGGCCSNVYTLEAIVKASPKSGNLITFAQFLVVSIDGLWKNLTFKSGWPSLAKRHIPIRHWLLIVSLFFTISVMNNYALGFHISMPLHIVFRSGSLMISMLVGYKYFGQTYSKHKISGVSIVTIGIILSTLSSSHHEASNAAGSYLEWVAGIGILSLGLVMSCFLGQYQQALYAKFGQQWQEGLFYTHLLSLPAFGLFYQDLINQVHIYNASEAMSIGMFLKPVLSGPMARQIWDILGGVYLDSVYVPSLWTFLVLNVTTQYFCISGVHRATSMASSVTLNLILTCRKFVSLIISVVLFQHQFGIENWIGATLVFLGTALYSYPDKRVVAKKSD